LRVNFQFNELVDLLKGIPEEKPGPFNTAEEIGYHGKGRALHPLKKECRPACPVNAAVNFSGFEVRVDFFMNPYELPGSFKVGNAFGKMAITHTIETARGNIWQQRLRLTSAVPL
jgi:hypothetical protein